MAIRKQLSSDGGFSQSTSTDDTDSTTTGSGGSGGGGGGVPSFRDRVDEFDPDAGGGAERGTPSGGTTSGGGSSSGPGGIAVGESGSQPGGANDDSPATDGMQNITDGTTATDQGTDSRFRDRIQVYDPDASGGADRDLPGAQPDTGGGTGFQAGPLGRGLDITEQTDTDQPPDRGGDNNQLTSQVSFDTSTPTGANGDVLSQVEDQLIEKYGAVGFEYARINGDLVARFQGDNGTQYIPINLDGDADAAQEFVRRQEYAQAFDVDPSEIEFTEDGQLTDTSETAIGRQLLADDLSQDVVQQLDQGEDFQVTRENGEVSVELTPYGREFIAEARTAGKYGIPQEALDVELGTAESGDEAVSFQTESAQRAVLEQQAGADATIDQVADGVFEVTNPANQPLSGLAADGRQQQALATFGDQGKEFVTQAQRLEDVQQQVLEGVQADAAISETLEQQDATRAMERIIGQQGGDVQRAEAVTGRDLDLSGDVIDPDEYVAQQVTQQFDTLERGRDFQVTQDDGQYTVEYTDRGLTALETELETETGKRLDVTRGENGIQIQRDTSERFGNAEVNIPFTGGTSIEDVLTGAVGAAQGFGNALGEGATYVSPLPNDSAVDNVLKGAGQGIGDLVSAPAAFPLLAKEAGEATGYVLKTGDVGQSIDRSVQIGEAAKQQLIQIGEYAQENPFQFGGQLAGAALAGGAAVKGVSRFAGTSAGRAAAVAVQPGEELAIRGLTSAAGRTATGAAAIDATPGSQLRPIDIARLTGTGITSRLPRFDLDTSGVRGRLAEANAQTPGIEFTTNPDAPRFAVDDNLGAQTLENARRALDTDGDLNLNDIAQRAAVAEANLRTGFQELRNRGLDTVDDVLDRTANPEPEDIGRRIGELSARGGDAVRDATPDVDTGDLTQRANEGGRNVGDRIAEGVREIGELGPRAGERIGNRIMEETRPSNVGVREANTAIAARFGLQKLDDLESRIGFLSGSAGRQVGESIGTGITRAATGDAATQLDVTTSSLARRYDELTTRVAEGSRRTGEAVGDAFLTASQLRNLGIRVRSARPPREGSGRAVDLADVQDLEGIVDFDEGELQAMLDDANGDSDADAGTADGDADTTTVEVGGNQIQIQRLEQEAAADADATPAAETSQLRRVPFQIGDETLQVTEVAVEEVGDVDAGGTDAFTGGAVAEEAARGAEAASSNIEVADSFVDNLVQQEFALGFALGLEQGVDTTGVLDVGQAVETDTGVGAGTESGVGFDYGIDTETEAVGESVSRTINEMNAQLEQDEGDQQLFDDITIDEELYSTGFADFDAL